MRYPKQHIYFDRDGVCFETYEYVIFPNLASKLLER